MQEAITTKITVRRSGFLGLNFSRKFLNQDNDDDLRGNFYQIYCQSLSLGTAYILELTKTRVTGNVC